MQPENTTTENNDLFGDLTFDHTAKQYISSIANWAIVIVVVAVISYAISLFQLFSAHHLTTTRSEGFDFGFKMTGSDKTSTIITILIGVLVNIFLFRFATQARTGLNGLNQTSLNSSFNSLKIYFMISAILCILIFLIVILAVATLSTSTSY
jgi:hypothetical protein